MCVNQRQRSIAKTPTPDGTAKQIQYVNRIRKKIFFRNLKWNQKALNKIWKSLCNTTGKLTYLITYGAEPFLRSRQFCSPSRTSQHFMEPEGSVPCSQDPYQSTPSHSISLRSILILSTHLRLGLPSLESFIFKINTVNWELSLPL
jgi:hypothetical protein